MSELSIDKLQEDDIIECWLNDATIYPRIYRVIKLNGQLTGKMGSHLIDLTFILEDGNFKLLDRKDKHLFDHDYLRSDGVHCGRCRSLISPIEEEFKDIKAAYMGEGKKE